MNLCSKFKRLERNDRWLFIKSVWMLIIVQIGLTTIGYARLIKWIEKRTEDPAGFKYTSQTSIPTEVYQKAVNIYKIVTQAALHGTYPANCLRRAILVWWFLRKEHIDAIIRFGANKVAEQKIAAHAWVEVEGMPVGEAQHFLDSYGIFRSENPKEK